MKAAVALLCSVAVLTGCFPNNPQHRTYAKYAEGAALIAGIAVSAVANTGADCDQMDMPGPNVDNDCRSNARWLGTVGLVLILGGLLGFVATIATAEDVELKKEQKQATENPVKTELKLPPGVTAPAKKDATPATDSGSGSGAGSGSGEQPAPATPPTPPADSTTPAPSY
jgi:hypothetical protein